MCVLEGLFHIGHTVSTCSSPIHHRPSVGFCFQAAVPLRQWASAQMGYIVDCLVDDIPRVDLILKMTSGGLDMCGHRLLKLCRSHSRRSPREPRWVVRYPHQIVSTNR